MHLWNSKDVLFKLKDASRMSQKIRLSAHHCDECVNV